MTEPLVTWSAEHEEDYQRRLLAAYRLVYRAHNVGGYFKANEYMHLTLDALRAAMSDRTRMLASQWERAYWKKEGKG